MPSPEDPGRDDGPKEPSHPEHPEHPDVPPGPPTDLPRPHNPGRPPKQREVG